VSKDSANYRADIDGLRAVAVLAVLFYHADLHWMSGGYVGVDIFFVISGYLITSILKREIEQKRFTLAGFYERRFRRLLPALFVVVTATFVAGLILLHPRDLLDLGQSVIATALFSSNILFNLESGYFDGPALFKPLLHTWSLGVEEQYYIVFPLILIGLARFSAKAMNIGIVGLFVISLVMCIAFTANSPSASFYLLHTRAWELLAGSILAIGVLPVMRHKALLEAMALLGVVLICIAFFSFDKYTVFPGSAALVPVIGACLIICSGERQVVGSVVATATIVSRCLGLRPIVFVGLISYSLYLWHWPLLVYANYLVIGPLSAVQTIVVMFAVLVLSFATWRFVETPFRYKALLPQRRSMLSGAAAISVIMAVVGLTVVFGNGLPQRYGYSSHIASDEAVRWKHWGVCQTQMNLRLTTQLGPCRLGNESGDVSFFVWGDSHARSIAPAVHAYASQMTGSGEIATRGGCPPLLDVYRPGIEACAEFNDKVLEYVLSKPDIQTVVLSARWSLAYTGTRYKEELGNSVKLVERQLLSTNNSNSNVTNNAEVFKIGLERSVATLTDAGKRIVIINQVPEIGYDLPSIHFVANVLSPGAEQKIAPTLDEYRVRNGEVTQILNALAEDYGVSVVSPQSHLCSSGACRITAEGKPLYLDDNHLSILGSRALSDMFEGYL